MHAVVLINGDFCVYKEGKSYKEAITSLMVEWPKNIIFEFIKEDQFTPGCIAHLIIHTDKKVISKIEAGYISNSTFENGFEVFLSSYCDDKGLTTKLDYSDIIYTETNDKYNEMMLSEEDFDDAGNYIGDIPIEDSIYSLRDTLCSLGYYYKNSPNYNLIEDVYQYVVNPLLCVLYDESVEKFELCLTSCDFDEVINMSTIMINLVAEVKQYISYNHHEFEDKLVTYDTSLNLIFKCLDALRDIEVEEESSIEEDEEDDFVDTSDEEFIEVDDGEEYETDDSDY